jgi:predicted MFS family arabinose efflux permease
VVLALVFLEGLSLYGPFAFIASHLHLNFGLSLASAGALVMGFGLGGFVFALLSGPLVRQMGEKGLVGWGSPAACQSAAGWSAGSAAAGC